MIARYYFGICRPGQDATAEQHLERRGYKTFRPVMPGTVNTRWNRTASTEKALFPGYVFIREPADIGWGRLRGTPGMAFDPLLKINDRLQYLYEDDDDFLAMVRTQERLWAAHRDKPKAPFTVGDQIRIVDGPWVELLGVIETVDESGRLGCLIDMLGGHVRAFVDSESIRRAC